jgi:hypothetical protein
VRACAPARVLGRQPVVESSQTVSGCCEENSGLRVRVLRTHQAVACCPTRRSSRRSGRNRDEHSRARTSLPGRPQDAVAVRTHHPHCLSLSPLLAASTHRFRTGSHHCPGTDSACTARTPRTADRPCPQPNATRGGRPSSASSSLRPTHFLSALAQRRDSRPGRRKLCAME